jgi:D-alanyl-lipoteichoic acid acyltransferase DltB (MBOAT superfamily)
MSISILVAASLFFYGWWNPSYLILMIISILVNFSIGKMLVQNKAKWLLVAGLVFNLGLISYFKYFNFLLENISNLFTAEVTTQEIILPLAISFFTFQQIAFLIDAYRGEGQEQSLLRYSLFITFFPQLIAGPIVHHKEMLPQFDLQQARQEKIHNIAIGLSIFAIGLFKKTVIADGIAGYANDVFQQSTTASAITFFDAWGGALAYTFQLYFDFSGYSDMAIGIARMFGIILPLNFYSPYKAVNISEFWRRWHMTLSRFLRDYVYIALGGNRKGSVSRHSNLMITMLLGGLWHGAGWNFVIWGGLHGLYLTMCHFYQEFKKKLFPNAKGSSSVGRFFAWLLTFIVVVVSWVFFRATTFDSALSMLSGMLGFNGVELPNAIVSRLGGMREYIEMLGINVGNGSGSFFIEVWAWNIILLICVLVLPNTMDMFNNARAALVEKPNNNRDAFWPGIKLFGRIQWKTSTGWALTCALALTLGVLTLSQVSEFLYFQF